MGSSGLVVDDRVAPSGMEGRSLVPNQWNERLMRALDHLPIDRDVGQSPKHRRCSVGPHGRTLEWGHRHDKSSDIWSWLNRRPPLSSRRPLQPIQHNSKSSVVSQTHSETHNKTLPQVPPTFPLKLPDRLNT